MTQLILPPHIAAQRRPYAAVSTVDLLNELQLRGAAFELTCNGAMPTPKDMADQKLTEAQIGALRQQAITALFQQLGPALMQSDLPYIGTGTLPPDLREMLVVKLIVVRHPLRPANPVQMPPESSTEPA